MWFLVAWPCVGLGWPRPTHGSLILQRPLVANLAGDGLAGRLSQIGGPLDDQASALVSEDGIVPVCVTRVACQRPQRLAEGARMGLDVSAVRAMYPALADGYAYLDGAAGPSFPRR